MVAVPADTPLTNPEPLIVATDVLVLLHTPPDVTSLKGVVDSSHTVATPEIEPDTGSGFTVTTVAVADTPQPFVTVYDIVAVPTDAPLTKPELLTVTIDVAVLLHTPPMAASLKRAVDETQTIAVPVIEPDTGSGFTVTTVVVTEVPQLLVTV